jgi:Fic family protein
MDEYYSKEVDERQIKDSFNFALISKVLRNHDVINKDELTKLKKIHEVYLKNISQLTEKEYSKELERLAIDLSWKSSQIEGNTYSLLETERLLKEKETASGKTKEEAVMLLNHKDALDFIIENPDYLNPISVSKIEDIHSILIKELGVERNIRKKRVGISGTNYRPLDNEFQIKEALRNACELINSKENPFEKALLALVLLSYIQPFMDGNKRTARIVSNAILMGENHCPLSFRTVDSIEYKKAMLLFYEQNNISKFKEIFISQYEFAVKTYF